MQKDNSELRENLTAFFLTRKEVAAGGGVLPAPVAQGDILHVNAAVNWAILPIGTAHQLGKVNAAGNDIVYESFNWGDISSAAAANMAHDHSAAGEGGEIPLASLGGYAEGALVIGGAVDWESLAEPGTAGYALVSDGTTFAWDQTPAWTGLHNFNAGLEVADDQPLNIGDGADGVWTFDTATSRVVYTGVNILISPSLGVGQRPRSKFRVNSTKNALIGLNDPTNYNTILSNQANDTGEMAGLGFYIDSGVDDVGAAVGFVRTGLESMGELRFYTKRSAITATDPVLAMTLQDDGTSLFTENMLIDPSDTITTPGGTFHAHTGASGVAAHALGDDGVFESSAGVGVSLLTPDASTSYLIWGSPTNSIASQIRWCHDDDIFTIHTPTQLDIYIGGATDFSFTANKFGVAAGSYISETGIRATLASAEGLYVPWITGDAGTTAYFGSTNASNDQIAIEAYTYSDSAIYGQTNTGFAGVWGVGTAQHGVYGSSAGGDATDNGVWGNASAAGRGVYGSAQSGVGVQGASATGIAGRFDLTGAGTAILLCEDNGTDVFVVDDGGNVGIGTSTPDDLLHVRNSAAASVIRIGDSDLNEEAKLWLMSDNSYFEIRVDDNNNFWEIRDGNAGFASRLYIDDVGNVGIATASPSDVLHVQGAVLREGWFSAQPALQTAFDGTLTDIDLDTEIRKDIDYYTHAVGSDNVTITETGWYRISYCFNVETDDGTRTDVRIRVFDDGIAISQSESTTYTRTVGDGGQNNSASNSFIAEIAASSVVDFRTDASQGGAYGIATANYDIIASSQVTIERIDET